MRLVRLLSSLGRGRGPAPRLVLYTRAGCGVCARAEALVRREARRADVEVVDIDRAGLVERYGVRVPVITLDGVEIGELEWAPGTLRRALRAARRLPSSLPSAPPGPGPDAAA